jgi:hypothetical protein
MEWLSPILVYHIVLLLTKVGGHHDYTKTHIVDLKCCNECFFGVGDICVIM